MALPLIPIAVSFAARQAAKFLAKRAALKIGPKIVKGTSTWGKNAKSLKKYGKIDKTSMRKSDSQVIKDRWRKEALSKSKEAPSGVGTRATMDEWRQVLTRQHKDKIYKQKMLESKSKSTFDQIPYPFKGSSQHKEVLKSLSKKAKK